MEHKTELAIVLKTFPYQERDKVCVLLTEHSGKITALAKGAIHSRRFGGALDTLTCSKVRFVQKPNAEMARIEEAVVHHEFRALRLDYDLLAVASFGGEFCLRLIEPHAPARDLFVVLSNFLFYLDAKMNPVLCIDAFLAKALYVMGYAPDFSGNSGARKHPTAEALVLFSDCISKTFKELQEMPAPAAEVSQNLFSVLIDFVHHQVPGLPSGGFKSLGMLDFGY